MTPPLLVWVWRFVLPCRRGRRAWSAKQVPGLYSHLAHGACDTLPRRLGASTGLPRHPRGWRQGPGCTASAPGASAFPPQCSVGALPYGDTDERMSSTIHVSYLTVNRILTVHHLLYIAEHAHLAVLQSNHQKAAMETLADNKSIPVQDSSYILQMNKKGVLSKAHQASECI
jgi:hypothetical protein